MTSYFRNLAPGLSRSGFDVLPANGKKIPIKGWADIPLPTAQIDKWASNGYAGCNVSIRTGAVACVDIDCYDPEVSDAIETAFMARFGEALVRVGQAPKRALTYQATTPCTKITSPIWVSPDGVEHRVEILGVGQQFVAHGIHPDTGKPYTWPRGDLSDHELWMLPEIDLAEVAAWIGSELPALIPMDWVLKTGGSARRGVFDDDGAMPIFKPTHDDVDLAGATWILAQLTDDDADDRATWLQVGMALHHQFEGDEAACELWDTWSQRSGKYVGDVCADFWRNSFKGDRSDREVVTIGAVKHRVGLDKWAAYRKSQEAITSTAVSKTLRERVSEASEEELKGVLAQEIRAAKLSNIDRDMLIQAWRARMRAHTGQLPTLSVVRKDLTPPQEHFDVPDMPGGMPSIFDQFAASTPDWAKNWVWLRDEDKFFNVLDKSTSSITSFNMAYQRHRGALTVGDSTVTPVFAMQSLWGVPCIAGTMFLPGRDAVVEVDGYAYANNYRDLRIRPAAKVTDAGRKLRNALTRHFETLVPDKWERDILIYWLAHQYQLPGVKVRWAPVIKGCEGDGKSILSTILATALGNGAVGTINGDTIQSSDFTSWQTGCLVQAIEELKFHGHNRFDVANRVKPAITNDVVEVHPKGRDPYVAVNVTNYIAFTNHNDALPLTEGDRRWFVIFSPWSVGAALDAHMLDTHLMSSEAHFNELFDLVGSEPAQLALWLSEQQKPAGFHANGRAPTTAAKGSMIDAAVPEVEKLARAIIAQGAPGISPTVVVTKYLTEAVRQVSCDGDTLHSKQVSKFLCERGYKPLKGDGTLKWGGLKRTVYVAAHLGDVTTDWARAELDKTVQSDLAETFDA